MGSAEQGAVRGAEPGRAEGQSRRSHTTDNAARRHAPGHDAASPVARLVRDMSAHGRPGGTAHRVPRCTAPQAEPREETMAPRLDARTASATPPSTDQEGFGAASWKGSPRSRRTTRWARSTHGPCPRRSSQRLETLEEGTHEYAYVRNTLVELNLALVKFAASRFRSRSEPMEDIVQVGTIGLIKAIDRFELSRGVEFPTFAMPTIVGEIKRFFRDTTWSVRVPRRLQELRLDLAKAGDELAQQLDRAPTVAELAEQLGISEEEVVEGMAREQRVHRELAGRPARGGRLRGRARRPDRLRGPRTGRHRVRRVAEAADRRAAPAGPHDPLPALRRQHDAVARSARSSASRRCTCHGCCPAPCCGCAGG